MIHETSNRVKRQFLGPKIFNSLVIQKPLYTESVVIKAPSRRLTCLKFDWRCVLFFNSFSSKPYLRVKGFEQQCQSERFLIKVLKERVHFKNMPHRHVTAISETQIRQKWYWWKWFVFFEHTIGHLSFVCVLLDYFSFFPFFFICFVFVISFLHLTFKPETQRDQTSIDSRIDITKNWRPPEIGSEMLEDSPQTGSQEFWTFKPFKL